MATKIIITCDKCGAKLSENAVTKLQLISTIQTYPGAGLWPLNILSYDLCDECTALFKKCIEKWAEGAN